MDTGSETKLRSTRSSATIDSENSTKFEFDFSHEIDPNEQLECLSRNIDRHHKSSKTVNIRDTKISISKMVLDIEDHNINYDNDDDDDDDPLPDTLYKAFHKKMLRQENRMIESDINESYESAEHLEQLYNKLEVITWPTALAKMTKINDPTDDDELGEKRQMAMNKIMDMLDKYKLMNEHASILQKNKSKFKINPLTNYTKIYRNVDHLLLDNYESSSDEDEEEFTTEQIRIHRIKKRTESCGGVITIGLKTFEVREHYTIIAQPLKKPYVIKLTSKEKKKLSNIEPQRRVFKYSRTLKNNVGKLKHRDVVPVTMIIDDNERKSLISQYNIENDIEETTEINPTPHEIDSTPPTLLEMTPIINESSLNSPHISTDKEIQYVRCSEQSIPAPLYPSQQLQVQQLLQQSFPKNKLRELQK
ncbi:similar to Saccharomyces cerevisiae YDR181C SAS4 Subunit of the SAS complex (Sas2p, Sas4p, Sas5p), which acetylates free histones and nucleosomes and regulates transcriptional silencing [Maudiozyma barnettii]|uniref:Similar to Saccharomyces cerevisiae YDR181C SAS4 Subunit of the SAS complex (Sas2p, Sas4p, Sas5p), which acetylates free histones and nucleosomes and regulates transcriptional silencing n=1 Tax=Maudiozyma barnettii TaxID=61262 RepID=A0A8H2VE96_9SACH|nr:Sas4p [Kazachstania barnettii]CAB4253936.1 similar to Saccharomyces cerevisiae YDR181C SAS4 Subunit of the SAS complex (Sas2p, Sas4p, Sas5p), which acetylates free histones and nucleosomes and regulates transcriptional silencing [Kazachstania barnettii]CAD1781686.1 similar to Saccharomyces cerevisiae YDR181C SAS4 Subunit of the SAS complex (Sas2p, Sas4p, Sas5p), which acetylates free histones and nucleosomes and regulates transcriptional silencing [Kazachstania barnettii]